MACCGKSGSCGPGYSSPRNAYLNGPREKVLFTTCVRPKCDTPDYLAIVDVDPQSDTYCQVIHRTAVTNNGDELHHSGWNTCSSCFGDTSKRRNRLVLPCLGSDRVYVVKVIPPNESSTGKYSAELDCTVEGSELHRLDVSAPHTTHCLPNGCLMISTMGDASGNGKGSLLTLQPDGDKGYKATKLWNSVGVNFGYDFWYQPYFDVLVTSEWGAPNCFKKGFLFEDLDNFGSSLHFWSWSTGKLIKSFDLNDVVPGTKMPLEVRFLHDPKKSTGYVGCALSGNVFRFTKSGNGVEDWKFEEVIRIPPKKVKGWLMPELPALITDILISMDDRFLYVSCWGFGEMRQYSLEGDIPKLVGVVRIGGIPTVHAGIEILEDPESNLDVEIVSSIKGERILGGSQMVQLSLDGKRLYITNSLHSAWDKQFYPEMFDKGSQMVLVDVNNHTGGLCVNKDFIVNFSNEPNGPSLAHEMRYPGGDCTSDIFLAETDS